MKAKYALALACAAVSGQAADKPLEPSTTSRSVSCQQDAITVVNTQVGYASLLQFNQAIAGAFWGDVDRWSIDKQANLLLVRPSVKGSKTDVHVVMSGGDVCSFNLREVSDDKAQAADIRLHVNAPNDHSEKQVFYTSDQVESFKQSAADAQRALEDEKASEQKRLAQEKEAARAQQEATLKHGYHFQQNGKLERVFGVRSIYRDGAFTVIEATPQEAPAVYEVRDGKPSLIQFEYDAQTHRYRIPKLVDQGYLRVGKSKLDFAWEG